MAEGQEAGWATSLVCFCCVGVDTTHFALTLMIKCPPAPLPCVFSHPGKLTLHLFFASVAIPYFCLQRLPFILLYWRDLQLALMCFHGIDFHKLRLVPIISVRAVMIRLWIISLDHCFLLLCWLGAIHLPPSSGVTNAVKLPLLFTPLLPPTFPDPVTHHDLHLSSSAEQYLSESKLRCNQCQPLCVYGLAWNEETPPLILLSSHDDL